MRMRLPPKALAWGVAAVMPIMASGFSLPVDAATSAAADQEQGWLCSQLNLPVWLRVCVNAHGRHLYQVNTGSNGPHGTFTASEPVALQQIGSDIVSVSFSPPSAASFRSASDLLGMA